MKNMKTEDAGVAGAEDRAGISSRMVAALERRGYVREQMAFQEVFRLDTDGGATQIPIEILVSVEGRPALLIKCIDGPISAREDAAVALARLFPGGPVPFAVVANETETVVIETVSRKTYGVGSASIPTPGTLRVRFRSGPSGAPDPVRREREKRILAVYVHLRCPVPRGPY